jgi:hypothetical protein
MRNTRHIAKGILIIGIFALVPFLKTRAATNASPSSLLPTEENSLYRYNALENKNSFLLALNTVSDSSNTISANPALDASVTASPDDNIGQQLQDQEEKIKTTIETAEKTIKEIESRNGIKTFLIGSNLGNLKFQLVQIGGQIDILDNLSAKTPDTNLKIQINSQKEALSEEKIKVENLLSEQENKFVLFGWFIKVL